MSIVTINDEYLSNIANAIRDKNLSSDKYNPSEMANAIKNIPVITDTEPVLEDIIVNPKITEQTIVPSANYDGIGQVKVNAVTSSIDSDIKSSNIKKGVNILGVNGTLEEGIIPTGTKFINSNGDYDVTNYANASVDIDIIEPTGTIEISANGTYDVKNYASASVHVESSGGSYAPRYFSFNGCTYEDLNPEVSGIDGKNLESLEKSFISCSKLKSIDLSKLNTSNVTTLASLFSGCSSLTNVNLENFDVSNVTNMRYVFKNCSSIVNLDLSSWGTCKSKYFNDMFYGCSKLQSIDLRNFNTTGAGQTTSSMFQSCSSLKHLDMRSFDFYVSQYSSMFSGVPNDCEIIVKDDTMKTRIKSFQSTLTNVKTLEEYLAEGGV